MGETLASDGPAPAALALDGRGGSGFDASVAVRLVPGSVFARDYRVVQPLSEGGMGAVYLVEQISTGARRALKLMLPHLASDDEARKRFEREAKVGARIVSDHVVQVLAAGVDEATGSPFLVMELLEGGVARRARPRTTGPCRRMTRAALLAARSRDGRSARRGRRPPRSQAGEPARRRGSPRDRESSTLLNVLDFGDLCKLTLDAGTAKTAPIGTLAWMAPEQGPTRPAR